jgi:ribosomal protein S27AE
MSTKHIHTAADLVRFGASVRIECGDCGSARTMSGIELVQACGSGRLAAARARMKCGRCGGKAARLAVLPPV